MKARLSRKVAVITGAGSSSDGIGTGQAISIALAREGCKVLLVDIDSERVANTLSIIEAEGGSAQVFIGDITQEIVAKEMINYAVSCFGTLDILVNNLGVMFYGNVLTASEHDWEESYRLNVRSMIYCSKYAIPIMGQQKQGSIINLSSSLALRAASQSLPLPYSVAKGAVISLTTTMAVQHGKDSIRVNAILPGLLRTPMATRGLSQDELETRRKSVPLQTQGDAWDVAMAAVFLASDESKWITGVVLPVDGGMLVTTPLSMLDSLGLTPDSSS
jgi:NAD(P)-dependent dehydrogenase (short-subunit alcohol dehydrogenase family)|tara:strand:- start:100 stop:924 length:825 start_codon:yes stop_codon:yes gene_type:complete